MQTDSAATLVLTPAEAAAHLLSCPRTLERWRHAGTGPKYVRIGRRVGYRLEDLIAFVDANVRTHTRQGRKA